LALNASTALGCSCSDPSQRKKFREADYVFLGTAIRMAYSNIQEFPDGVTFKVERQWKGTKLGEPLVNFTFDSPGMCGDLHLAEGQQFLIYAYRQKNDLSATRIVAQIFRCNTRAPRFGSSTVFGFAFSRALFLSGNVVPTMRRPTNRWTRAAEACFAS
jgi:hypothetical protein